MNFSSRVLWAGLLWFSLPTFPVPGGVQGGSGGGPVPLPAANCISAAERQAVAMAIAKNLSTANGAPSDPATKYPFQPIAGNVWQDRFILNFVDQDSSAGILDWDCSDFTYDGHSGHDIDLRSFGEQDIGVPVFAALNGTVVAVHDGEFDRRTAIIPGAVANYVVLDHGDGQHSLYWHLRNNSVAVALNQVVAAGTQLGLAASSGMSSGPHLHFESQLNNTVYEPYAGDCQTATPGRWVNQTPIRRDTYLGMFALHGTVNPSPFLPENPPHTGTFVRTGANQPIGVWYILHNLPSLSTWRARYLRPNGTAALDSGAQAYNNAASSRFGQWWMYYTFNPDTPGTWTLEFSVNATVLVSAPFLVLNAGGAPTNQPPNPIIAAFDPPVPSTNDVVFCRLDAPLLGDPDYDFVRYRFQWTLNGVGVRDVTNAAFSDAVPRGIAQTGDLLSCTVTPSDGITNGQPVTVSAFVGGAASVRLNVTRLSGSDFRLSWPAFGPPYTLEAAASLGAPVWLPLTNGISQSGGQNITTNPGDGNPRFFRLRLQY